VAGQWGRLRIACIETLTSWLLIPVLRQWRSHPGEHRYDRYSKSQPGFGALSAVGAAAGSTYVTSSTNGTVPRLRARCTWSGPVGSVMGSPTLLTPSCLQSDSEWVRVPAVMTP
jgi:hypothetical protein